MYIQIYIYDKTPKVHRGGGWTPPLRGGYYIYPYKYVHCRNIYLIPGKFRPVNSYHSPICIYIYVYMYMIYDTMCTRIIYIYDLKFIDTYFRKREPFNENSPPLDFDGFGGSLGKLVFGKYEGNNFAQARVGEIFQRFFFFDFFSYKPMVNSPLVRPYFLGGGYP